MMGGMRASCHYDDFQLAEMDSGRLELAEIDRVEAHLADCVSCADRSESVRSLLAVMRRDPIRLEPQRLAHIHDNVERVLISSSLQSLGTPRSLSDRPLRAAALGVGIGILLAGVVVVGLLVETSERSPFNQTLSEAPAQDLRELYPQTDVDTPAAPKQAKISSQPLSAATSVEGEARSDASISGFGGGEASHLQVTALLQDLPRARRGRVAGFKRSIHRVEQALAQGRFRRARRMAIRLLARAPGRATSALLRTYVAESFVRPKRYAAAAKSYKDLYDRYPNSELGVYGLYMAGVVTLKDLEQPAEAAALFKRYVVKHLGSDHEQDAYKMLCRALLEQNEHGEASNVARSYLQRFPKGDYRSAMKWLANQQ